MTLRQAIINALHQCHRDNVKPIARNIAVRLPAVFVYTPRYIEIELADMVQQGIVEKPTPRGGYVAKVRRVEFCPVCRQPLPQQLELPLKLSRAN